MKVKELLEKAKKEIKTEDEQKVVDELKVREREIRSCKKTLAKLEKSRNELLEKEVDDLELDEYEY